MSVLPIVTYNDPVLREKTKEISSNNDELQELIQHMFDTMYNSNGVGLAAPQIGRSDRLFVMDADAVTEEIEEEEDLGPMVFINPEIVEKSPEKIKMEEGCLSIPELRDDVTRPERITVKYRDRNFEEKILQATGWPARVIQHETDHLNGVLFIDYLSAFRKRIHKSLLSKIDEGTLETDYPLVPKKIQQI
ncbi:MAG: peptide deformylase [Balneolaceae bacterium]